jgi:hypothetical protein
MKTMNATNTSTANEVKIFALAMSILSIPIVSVIITASILGM